MIKKVIKLLGISVFTLFLFLWFGSIAYVGAQTTTPLFSTSLDSAASVSTPIYGTGVGSSIFTNPVDDFVTGRTGNGIRVDQAYEYVRFQVTDGTVQNIELDKGTIDFWYEPFYNNTDGISHRIFGIDPKNLNGSIALYKRTSSYGNDLYIQIRAAGINYITTIPASTYSWTANTWVNLRITWDSTVTSGVQNTRFYLNGIERAYTKISTGPFSMPAESVSNYIYIGSVSPTEPVPATGVIDDFTIYPLAIAPSSTPTPTQAPTLTPTPTPPALTPTSTSTPTPTSSATTIPTPTSILTSTPTPIPTSTPTASQNALINPGFENGATGWQKATFGGRSIVSTQSHSGTYSEQMIVSKLYPRSIYQDVAVIPAVSYDMEGWIKLNGVNGKGATIKLSWLNAAGVADPIPSGNLIRLDVLPYLTGTLNWTPISGSFTAPPGAVVVRFEPSTEIDQDNSGTAWFDDNLLAVSIIGSPTPTSVVTDTPTPVPSATPTPTLGQGKQLIFSTYLGGSWQDTVRDMATDSSGNVYVTGGTASGNFPITEGPVYNAGDPTGSTCGSLGSGGPMDIFIVKYSPTGQMLWSRFLGGPCYDRAYAIEVDSQGYVYVGGRAGNNFPVTAGVLQTSFEGGAVSTYSLGLYGKQDGFVAKLTPDGSTMAWSTYFGGNDLGFIRDIDIDSTGNVYLALAGVSDANTSRSHVTAGAFQTVPGGGQDGVVAKISSDGQSTIWASYLGGSGNDAGGPSLRVDSTGAVSMLGNTNSTNLPTPNGYQNTFAGTIDVYLAKFNPTGNNLDFATYFGGSGEESVETHDISLDSSGNIFIDFYTNSTNLPGTTNGFQPANGGGYDIGIAKFSPTGQFLTASYLGGSGGESPQGLVTDSTDNLYVFGSSTSTNYPLIDPYQPSLVGSGSIGGVAYGDFTISEINPSLSQILWSTYLGGSSGDSGRAGAVDSTGAIDIGGMTVSTNFPLRNAFQTQNKGNIDGAVVRFK